MTDTRHALAALVAAHDALQARSWPGGPAQYEQQRDELRAAWVNARAALSAQPVAGAVAEPDCWAILTPNGSKLVSPDEAKGRKDAYPLYAVPQPQAAPAPEPSAQGEPVAWCLGNPKFAHSSNIIAAHEFTPDAEHADEWVALYASAPSTPPPAVVEDVPLTEEQCGAIYDALDEWAKSVDSYDFGLPHAAGGGKETGIKVIRDTLRGIAPKAAQP